MAWGCIAASTERIGPLKTIPAVSDLVATVIFATVGDMTGFRSASHVGPTRAWCPPPTRAVRPKALVRSPRDTRATPVVGAGRPRAAVSLSLRASSTAQGDRPASAYCTRTTEDRRSCSGPDTFCVSRTTCCETERSTNPNRAAYQIQRALHQRPLPGMSMRIRSHSSLARVWEAVAKIGRSSFPYERASPWTRCRWSPPCQDTLLRDREVC
jgi:hypothetical protein